MLYQNNIFAYPIEPEISKKTTQFRFLCGVKRVASGEGEGSDDVGNVLKVSKMIDDVYVYEEKWRNRVIWMPGDNVSDSMCVLERGQLCILTGRRNLKFGTVFDRNSNNHNNSNNNKIICQQQQRHTPLDL
jgi:hypothetical protein